jgi:hypothetical protein
MTPADLDHLFPDRHTRADAIQLHPAFRAYFIPLEAGETLTEEQRTALYAHLKPPAHPALSRAE